jgi:uncharacterized membrane-anchored protein
MGASVLTSSVFNDGNRHLAKVPAITLGFWGIKILATTLGETGGDTLSMELGWGYLASTALFGIVLLLLVVAQIRAHRFQPWLYWATIIASTTTGTTMADFATRSLGIGYSGGSILLFSLVLASLGLWYRATGTLAATSVREPRAEGFYWLTITFSQTLGTALGDWVAALPDDTPAGIGLGYGGGALLFGAALALVVVLHFRTSISRAGLFWAAFILTRPLGAVVGDFLDKPIDHGGLALTRSVATAVLAAAIAALILLLPQRAARQAH